MKIYWFFGILLYNMVHSYQNMPVRNTYLESLKKSRSRGVMITESQNFNRTIIPVSMSVQTMIHKPNNRKKSSSDGTFTIENLDVNYNLSSIGGYKDVKEELIQVIDFLMNTTNYSMYNVRTPKGILLEGPTGNGKTLLAKAFSGEINFPIIVTSGSEFNEKYVGVGASRIRELFQFAKENQPCVVFIDEIDALTRQRTNSNDGASNERDQTLNQLLVNLDGFVSNENVILIGATNRLDILDKAVLRPGRIDKIIHVPNPDAKTREQIILIHIKKKPINVPIQDIVTLTAGLNGAQIENLLNEATLTAIRDNTLPVNSKLLEETKYKLIFGQSTGKKNLSDSVLTRIAIHEIGHLIMAMKAKNYEKPTKVTVDSSIFNSLGYTLFEKKDVDEGIYLREYLYEHILILLGGRVAEEVVYGPSVSSGALSDLDTTFNVAKKMIMEYGMGGSVIYPHFSEHYRLRIDQEIYRIIKKAHDETRKTINENKDILNALSDELKTKKTLYYEDFKKYFN